MQFQPHDNKDPYGGTNSARTILEPSTYTPAAQTFHTDCREFSISLIYQPINKLIHDKIAYNKLEEEKVNELSTRCNAVGLKFNKNGKTIEISGALQTTTLKIILNLSSDGVAVLDYKLKDGQKQLRKIFQIQGQNTFVVNNDSTPSAEVEGIVGNTSREMDLIKMPEVTVKPALPVVQINQDGSILCNDPALYTWCYAKNPHYAYAILMNRVDSSLETYIKPTQENNFVKVDNCEYYYTANKGHYIIQIATNHLIGLDLIYGTQSYSQINNQTVPLHVEYKQP